jgi:hypothetical protein
VLCFEQDLPQSVQEGNLLRVDAWLHTQGESLPCLWLQKFVLNKGKKLDKFETRLIDDIFFGYASHSRAYRVLNLETNQIVETCEVTIDETQPRSQLVFECAGDDELGEEIFQ